MLGAPHPPAAWHGWRGRGQRRPHYESYYQTLRVQWAKCGVVPPRATPRGRRRPVLQVTRGCPPLSTSKSWSASSSEMSARQT